MFCTLCNGRFRHDGNIIRIFALPCARYHDKAETTRQNHDYNTFMREIREKVTLQRTCSATETSWNPGILDVAFTAIITVNSEIFARI